MCECRKKECVCGRRTESKKFEVGQCWYLRNSSEKRYVLSTSNIGDRPIVVRDKVGNVTTRLANGNWSAANDNADSDLTELYVEPKTYEIDVYIYDYGQGNLGFGTYLASSSRNHDPKDGPYFRAHKRIVITEERKDKC